MAAPMYKVQIQCKDLVLTLAIEESIFWKIQNDQKYIQEFFSYLVEQDVLKDAGLPSNVKVSDIKVIGWEHMLLDFEEEHKDIVDEDGSSSEKIEEKEPFQWNDESKRLLIALVDEKQAYRTDMICNQQVWKSIAKAMAKNGFNVNRDNVSEQWSHLTETYNRIGDRKFQSGFESINWEYYSILDRILKKDVSETSQVSMEMVLLEASVPCSNSAGLPTPDKASTRLKRRIVNKEEFKWDKENVKVLLSLIDASGVHLEKQVTKQNRIWDTIAKQMVEKGYKVPNGKTASKKWLHLLNGYKKVEWRQNEKQSENSKCKYLSALDNTTGNGNRSPVRVKATLVAPSVPSCDSSILDFNSVQSKVNDTSISKSALLSVPGNILEFNSVQSKVNDTSISNSALPLVPSNILEFNSVQSKVNGTSISNSALPSVPSNILDFNSVQSKLNDTSISNSDLPSIPSNILDFNSVLSKLNDTSISNSVLPLVPSNILDLSSVQWKVNDALPSDEQKSSSINTERDAGVKKKRRLLQETKTTVPLLSSTAPLWFVEYFEWKQSSEEQWRNEFKTLMNERTKAIHNLTSAINGLINNNRS